MTVATRKINDFIGQHAIVTGGGQGLGLHLSLHLLALGARVSLWDFNETALEAALETVPSNQRGNIHGDVVNVAWPDMIDAAFAVSMGTFGAPHILVNAAAVVGSNRPSWDYPVDEWQTILDVNLTGTFLCCRAIVPEMRKANYGRILNISSVAGKEGNPNASAYSASKAGVIGFTKSLGKETADQNISVNCVTPSIAETPGAMGQTQAHIERGLSLVPRGRFLDLQEAVDMFTWLVSPENSFATGATFDISGGRATY